LDVLLAIDRAGLVGADGPTHAGSFDLSFLRCIPNVVIMAPSDENECRQMLTTGYHYPGTAAVRYPRGSDIGARISPTLESLPIGKAQLVRQGKKIAILAFGSMLQPALQAAETCDATVINMRFIKPLDEAMVLEIARSHDYLLTVEENAVMGGAGAAVMECLQAHHLVKPVRCLGLFDQFIEYGSHETMLAECGLDKNGIISAIEKLISE